MRFPNKATVDLIRSQYPAGTRVELVQMMMRRLLRSVHLEPSGAWMTPAPSWCIGTTALA